MAIQVGGTTVIDNSGNFVNLNMPGGNYVLLGSVSMTGATSVSIDLSSYGLNTTSCSYQKYRIVLSEYKMSTGAGATLTLKCYGNTGAQSSGWGGLSYNVRDSAVSGVGSSITIGYEYSSTIITTKAFEFSLPAGYNGYSATIVRIYGDNMASGGPTTDPKFFYGNNSTNLMTFKTFAVSTDISWSAGTAYIYGLTG